MYDDVATSAQEPGVSWGRPMVRLSGGGHFKPFGDKGGVKKPKLGPAWLNI